jgi:eukaryotic-like serine/threonine-protein kinase
MGEVWHARDTRLDREVALKVIPEEVLGDAERRRRFEREARLLAALNHPGIAAIYAFEEIPGPPARHVLAMELLHGETLRERLRRGPLPEPRARELAAAIAEGLGAAHERGIVHRDLKPENLFVRSDGQAKILDFGLAKREADAAGGDSVAPTAAKTEAGVVVGTSGYMAPEQVTGGPADPRTDVFAFGCVLYEMLSGRRAFARATLAETFVAILRDAPEPLGKGTSPALARLVERCLEKRPGDRFPTARELAIALAETAPAPEPGPARPGRTPRRTRTVAAGAVALLALLAAAAWLLRPGPNRAGPVAVRSLAVLPFENLSTDPAQASLADAMTESLTTNLGRASALRVTSRAAVVGYAASKEPATKIAAALGVDALVTGSVQKSGDSLRVNVQVVEASGGKQLWSGPFAQTGGSLFALQDRVSRAILDALHVSLTPAEDRSLRSIPTANLAAYEHYVRGRLRVRRENPEDNGAAIDELEKAVALDPSFAAAHAELAHAYGVKVFYVTPGDRAAADKATIELETALGLDPDLGLAHYARGLLLWTPANHFPHEQAIRAYQRALALDPNYDDAHQQLGIVEMHVGLFDAAAAEFEAALRLDPTNTLARHRSGVVRSYQLRFGEAVEIHRGIPREFNPSLWTYNMAWSQLHVGQGAAETLAEFRRSGEKDRGGVVASVEAMAAALAGDASAAERLSAEAVRNGKGFGHFHHTAYNLACADALLGRVPEALEFLREAAASGFPCYPLFEKDPYLDRLRKDPGFGAFLEGQRRDWEGRRKLVATR